MRRILLVSVLFWVTQSSAHVSAEHNAFWGWGKTWHDNAMIKVIGKKKIALPAETIKKIPTNTAVRKLITPVAKIIRVEYNGVDTIARPGECYEAAYIEDKCDNIEKIVITREGYRENVIIPAVTKLVKYKVLMKEAVILEEILPPLYELIKKKVLISPAKTAWKKGNFTKTQKQVNGETFCLVNVPAKYKISYEKIMRVAAKVKRKTIPAVYKVYEKVIFVEKENLKLKEAYPALRKKVKMCAVSSGHYEWRSILCSQNATKKVLIKIEQALSDKGFLKLIKADGVIDKDTGSAIRDYQKKSKIVVDGLLTIETVKSLGVKY